MTILINKKAPDFTAIATGNQKITLSKLKGENVILYFYPKDNTPGCTTEGIDFGSHYKTFKKLNTVILGVSRDSISCHEKFKAKYDFPFDLVADPDEVICLAYDVIKQKNMYGKKVRGIERSTFLIDIKGVIQQEWRKVKVDGHVEEVLAALKKLN